MLTSTHAQMFDLPAYYGFYVSYDDSRAAIWGEVVKVRPHSRSRVRLNWVPTQQFKHVAGQPH